MNVVIWRKIISILYLHSLVVSTCFYCDGIIIVWGDRILLEIFQKLYPYTLLFWAQHGPKIFKFLPNVHTIRLSVASVLVTQGLCCFKIYYIVSGFIFLLQHFLELFKWKNIYYYFSQNMILPVYSVTEFVIILQNVLHIVCSTF